jgi:hypothetical protein
MVQFSVYGFLKRYCEKLSNPVEDSPPLSPFYTSEKEETNQAEISPQIPRRGRTIQFPRPLLLFFAGAAAGIASTASTYPFDIMRTQFALQTRSPLSPLSPMPASAFKAHDSMLSFVQATFRDKGLPGFFVGITPAIVGCGLPPPFKKKKFILLLLLKNVGLHLIWD